MNAPHDDAATGLSLGLCIPVFNDWESALILLDRIGAVVETLPHRVEVMFVDDGSTEPLPTGPRDLPPGLVRVDVLRLRRNLGHQRAIAVALSYLYVRAQHDAIIVMDADGEDDPTDIPKLIARFVEADGRPVVFAQRTKRSEGLIFRVGYVGFKAVHALLVGRSVEVGNFSILPRSALARLVAAWELWNHYAAAVYHVRLPIEKVAIARGQRIRGQSKMNVVSLVTHGLSAISVYHDTVSVRTLAFLLGAAVATLTALGTAIVVRLLTELAIPGWATSTAGILLVALMNLALMSMFMVLFALRGRSEYTFVPLRDHELFVLDVRALGERTRD